MSVQKVNDEAFAQQLQSNPKVVVKYYADWCGSCRLISPKYSALATKPEYSGVVFLDVNAEESPAARAAAGVDNLPFFATFKDGKLVEGSALGKIEAVESMVERLN